jgi:diketogulonate reductase-like aldo/keto reductase
MEADKSSTVSHAAEHVPFVILNNGIKMPSIGLGTYDHSEELEGLVKAAIIEHGYRHIDTASVYKNEEAIGRALKAVFEAGIKREELFITTKLWKDEFSNPEEAIQTSLKKLGLDYVDLYLVHWMFPEVDYEKLEIKRTPTYKVWAALEDLVKKGLTKSIGVSNCTVPVLFDIFTYCEIKPAVNQVEVHPYFTQAAFVKYHTKYGVHITAYAPLGAPAWPFKQEAYNGLNVLNEPLIKDLAAKYGKGAGQIVLNWHLH